MRSTPVCCSSARMLRPSRPMMRPFMSSEGRSTTDTAASPVQSRARRWVVVATRAAHEGAVLLGGLRQPAIELVELARQLFLLGDDALLDLLELALAAPRVILQRGTRLERGLPRLQLGGPADGVGLALAVRDDLLRGDAGVAEPAVGEPLVQEHADEQGEQADERIEPR